MGWIWGEKEESRMTLRFFNQAPGEWSFYYLSLGGYWEEQFMCMFGSWWEKEQEFSFRCTKFEMFVRHPSGYEFIFCDLKSHPDVSKCESFLLIQLSTGWDPSHKNFIFFMCKECSLIIYLSISFHSVVSRCCWNF